MSTLSELQADLKNVKQKLDELEVESRANAGALAGAIRKTRSQVQQLELQESVRRLTPSTALVNWQPRAGQANTPALEDSLLDRLRKGNSVADTIGNVQTFYGIQNLILDPTMEGIRPPAATSSVEAICSRTLLGAPAWWVVDGGTSATGSFGVEYLRDDPTDNPFSSAAVRMRLTATGSGTHTLQLRSGNWAIVNFPVLPYIVAAVRVTRLFNNNDTNVTSRKLILELYDQSSATVRSSTTVDLDLNVPIDSQAQVVTASLFAGQSWESDNFQIRVRLQLVTTGATGDAYFHIGEPQLTLSFSPDVPPYTPMLASYHPIKVASYGRANPDIVLEAAVVGDNNARIDITNAGKVHWGPGNAATDVTLERTGTGLLGLTTGKLRLADTGDVTLAGTAHPFQVGDDAAANIAVDGNEIEARNNGAKTTLFLQNDGGPLQFGGALVFANQVTSGVDADQNNYNPSGLTDAAVLRFNAFTAARTLTGLTATTTGHLLLLVNDTAQNLVLAHASGSSSAGNQFRCPGAASVTVRPRGAVFVMYVAAAWQVVAI